MVTAGATANTTEENSRASRESGLLYSHSHGESIAFLVARVNPRVGPKSKQGRPHQLVLFGSSSELGLAYLKSKQGRPHRLCVWLIIQLTPQRLSAEYKNCTLDYGSSLVWLANPKSKGVRTHQLCVLWMTYQATYRAGFGLP